jgi:hypothetical protein
MIENDATNKGGTTNYYDVPEGAKTLSDLIEYKNMSHGIGEMFAVLYALDGRAKRSIEGESRLRELNKIKFYIEREIALELKRYLS